MTGVYQIWLSDKHYYGGRATDFAARMGKHIHLLRHNKHANKHMQSVFNIHRKFEPELIIECSVEASKAYEQAWIDTHFGLEGCLNISNSNAGGSPRGVKKKYTKRSPEGCKNMSRHGKRGPQKQSTIDKRVATQLHNKLVRASAPAWGKRTATSPLSPSVDTGSASSITEIQPYLVLHT
jgi:hypothetical protein